VKLFGTDGVRGIPGEAPLLPETVRRLGAVVGQVVLRRLSRSTNGTPPTVLLGRDTRLSGPELAKSLAQGLAHAGLRTVDLGVVPTPAVAYLVPRHRAVLGTVISASHNPAEFNGIKFFDERGFKFSTDVEHEIESSLPAHEDPGAGRASRLPSDTGAASDYLDWLISTFPATRDLSGLRIVLDCAHGAAAKIGPQLLTRLGARVFTIGCAPNGRNINKDCGATSTARLAREVRRHKADCGIALDGDADRALFVDERGRAVAGDALIALSALHMQSTGALAHGTVVVTVMANLALSKFLAGHGIRSVSVPVGDRNVTVGLEQGGYTLGGENSGHIIFRRFAPTGDGLLTALQTLAAWQARGGKFSAAVDLYREFPQILKNVRIRERVPLESLKDFQRRVKAAKKILQKDGRVYIRYSGTEPLLRILVEGPRRPALVKISDQLARAFKEDAERSIKQGV
jgi:phosphoglucosamine mutase